MDVQTILTDVLMIAGAAWPLLSCVAAVLPAGKVKSVLLSVVVDGKALVAALKDVEDVSKV